jgi:hypothetical protein
MRYVQVMVGLLCAVGTGSAWAGPVVREASGPTAASIQAVVDQFRADLGPNNGVTPGSQPGGRREINWDGGGAAAPPTIDGSPLTRFAARGATFATPGTGFETSGAPLAEFAEINGIYPAIFAPFSAPRLFIALNSNVMDVLFNVPGNPAIPAGVVGFGAVFTDVDSARSTSLQFFAPDGTLLFERAVPAAAGNETQSFLGVSFDAGEIVGRVRLVSGNAAPGPDEAGIVDMVAMDDFIYGEPVSTGGLVISPQSGAVFQTGGFDLVIGVEPAAASLTGGVVAFDGLDVTEGLLACFRPGILRRGGTTFNCQVPRGLLTEGEHVLQVVVTFADQTSRRNAVRWTVVGAAQH